MKQFVCKTLFDHDNDDVNKRTHCKSHIYDMRSKIRADYYYHYYYVYYSNKL
jgi:hypothetical protein